MVKPMDKLLWICAFVLTGTIAGIVASQLEAREVQAIKVNAIRPYVEQIDRLNEEIEELNLEISQLKAQIEEPRVITYENIPLCGENHSSFKSYMDWRAVTDTSSKQYELLNSGIFNMDSGLLITEDGYVAVALGSRYGAVGDKFRITLSTGTVFKAIKADAKSDAHTVNGCHHSQDGSLVEFIVDTTSLRYENRFAYAMGDISYVKGYEGIVTSIEMEVNVNGG